MPTILHTGLGSLALAIHKRFEKNTDFRFQEVEHQNIQILEHDLQKAELFLIGPAIENPVKYVQKIYAADKHISVLILSLPSDYPRIKQSLQFAPFVGKNTLCIPYKADVNLLPPVISAIQRTRQKRSFSKINITGKKTSSFSNTNVVKFEHLGTFLNQAPIATLLVDGSDVVTAINTKARKLFNVDLEKERYLKLTDLFPPAPLSELKKQMTKTINQEEAAVIRWADRFSEVSTAEVYNEEGSRYHIILINDITERIEEEQRTRDILESLPQMAWTASADGYATYLTKSWYEYTGQTEVEALGTGWLQVVHPDDQEVLLKRWHECLATGRMFEIEGRYKRKDGAYRWHLSRGLPIKDMAGKIKLWAGTCTDIHDQKQQAEELDRIVKERTKELEDKNSELEQFAYVSSHDLQEPLRKIRMFAEMLKTASYDQLDDASRRHLDKISDTAARMSNSLKDLLNFTQIHKEEQVTDTDLNAVIANVLNDLELTIAQKNAVIHTDPLPVIKGIPVHLQQLFYNLLNNALKFSRKDIAPVIEIRSHTLSNEEIRQHRRLMPYKNYVEIVVKDNGIGFEQHFADRIFTIFQRLHSRTAYPGTGIGLALCKKIVTNHGGEIFAHSIPDAGATFHVILPLA